MNTASDQIEDGEHLDTGEDLEAVEGIGDGSHLDGWTIADDDEEETESDIRPVGADPDQDDDEDSDEGKAVAVMSEEEFFNYFCTALSIPGWWNPDLGFLAVQDGEFPEARKCSRVIYNLAKKHFPSWIPAQPEWLAELHDAAPFIYMKLMAFLVYLRERKARVVNPDQGTPETTSSTEPEFRSRRSSGDEKPFAPPANYKSPVNWLEAAE